MTAAEAATHLGRSARSVRQQCAAGRLTGVLIAGAWHVDPAGHPALRIAAGDFETGPAAAGSGLADLTAEQRSRAYGRLEAVRNFLQALVHKPASMTLGEFQTRWCETFNAVGSQATGHGLQATNIRVSRPSLHRWVKKYREGGVIALVDRRGGYRKPAEFSPEAREFILGLYLSQNTPSVPYIYTVAAGQAREHGWDLPGLRTVQRFLRERTDPKLITAGRSPKKFRDRCVPFIKRDWTAVAAMECWVADHRQFDVLLPRMVWNRHKQREEVHWFRPWITAYLDARSWQLVGWIIDFDSPNADRVMAAFGKGVEAHGVPEHLIADNGKDYRTHEFAGGRMRKVRKGETLLNQKRVTPLLEALGVQTHWAIPYNAKAKIIEPFFGIVAANFDKLWPTYCGRSPENKPEKLKSLRKNDVDWEAYNISVFRRAFEKWVAANYALAPSPAAAAAGRSPLRAFCELRRPDYRAVRPAAETLALLLTRSKRIRVEQNGVWVAAFQRHYTAPELEGRRAASGRDISRHVVYRYRPSDPSGVWIFDFRTDRFLCYAGPYSGEGMHPLGETQADREQLAGAMSIQRTYARGVRAEVRRLKKTAAEILIEAHAKGLAARGMLDDPATIKAPAAPSIKLIGDGEIDRAAQAGRRKRETLKRETASRAEVSELLLTGTDDQRPITEAADPLEMLTNEQGPGIGA